MKILVINGPNLQLLGIREPDIYGAETLGTLKKRLEKIAESLNVEVSFFQSNHEGEIVDVIGSAIDDGIDGIIINPAAYTHTSIAIHDALKSVKLPAIEVHISNIHKREEFRHHCITTAACIGQICGFGIDGYEWAFRALVASINTKKSCPNRNKL